MGLLIKITNIREGPNADELCRRSRVKDGNGIPRLSRGYSVQPDPTLRGFARGRGARPKTSIHSDFRAWEQTVF